MCSPNCSDGNANPHPRAPPHSAQPGHVDTFARDSLPPAPQWPDLLLDRPEFQYPEYLNAAVELTDRLVEKGFGDNTALIGNGRRRTYKELADWSNRLAHALVEDFGVKPGNRVLLRSGNNPAMVAAWLAVTKAGAVAVNTMPLLRAGELAKIVDKAQVSLALTDSRIADELVACAKDSRFLKKVINFDGTANHDAELDRVALSKSVKFDAVKTGRDDVALLGFTSGTTGEPKGTMHFHRDLLIIADGYAREVLRVTPQDVFVGSPPLAFTFGLGGLAIFPLRFGATATLLESATPANMIEIIETYKATISFTSPTAYRAMMAAMDEGRRPVLAAHGRVGRRDPARAGVRRLDPQDRQTDPRRHRLHGAAAYLHHQSPGRCHGGRNRKTGRRLRSQDRRRRHAGGAATAPSAISPCAARQAAGISPTSGRPSTCATAGISPATTSCRDANGVFHFAARADDMIISSGYNIAGPEVEAALLSHPDVAECAVIGAPDEERGQIVQAHVVLKAGRGRRRGCAKAPAGPREGDHRALQISALREVRRRAAQDADRQDPALQAEAERITLIALRNLA